jgi:predicted nucleic acid-binding protein
MEIIFDTSTLILIAKIDIARDVAESIAVIVPLKVQQEALSKKSYDAEIIRQLLKEGKILIRDVDQLQALKITDDFKLHVGEAEAFCLARSLSLPLAVDDGPTIKVCKVFGHPFVTAVHLLIRLAMSGRYSSDLALEKLNNLSRYGRYKPQIIEDAARRIREGRS